MNWQKLRKQLLPHIIIILIFIAASFIFLSPMLKGKVLPQNDVRQWTGSYQETKTFLDKTGERSLWTNSMFGGMPTYQIAPYSPNSLYGTVYLYGALIGGFIFPRPMDALFMYCLGFYLLLLAFRVNPWLAMAGGLVYAFSSFNIQIVEAGHMLQAYALGTAPLVLAAAVYTLRSKKYILGGGLFALALALHVRTNHPQMSYYTALVLVIYLIYEFIYHARHKQILAFFKASAVFLIGAILAIGATATFLITTAEYSKETTRGKSDLTPKNGGQATGLERDYAFGWSYGVGETFNIMIPDFKGGASGQIKQDNPDATKKLDPQVREVVNQFDQYWGDMPFVSGPTYFGAVVCFLFILGLLLLKGNDRWWMLTVAILSMMLAWGRNFADFNDMIFNYFPLYNKFRSVNFTLVMAGMVFPLLAFVVLDRISRNYTWNKDIQKKLIIAFAATGGLCLIFWLVPSLAGDFLKPDNADANMLRQNQFPEPQINMVLDGVAEARTNILQSDAIRSFILIALSAGMIFLFLTNRIKKEIMLAAVAVLMVADLFLVSKRYLNEKTFVAKSSQGASFFPSEADNFILQDKDPNYRVLNIAVNTFNDATTSYFHKSVGGYHGAKLRRFQELREKYLDEEVGLLQQNAPKIPAPQLMQIMDQNRKINILNMMNTKYIIIGSTKDEVIKNPYALGNAWFVKGIKTVPNADAELDALNGFNPADSAIIDDDYKDYLSGFSATADSSGSIKLTEYKPNHLTYKSNAAKEQFAVFSEVYYNNEKGWDAYIDGQLQKHVRVNFLLRGLRVPSGNHTVEFKFAPKSFAKGETISLICSLLLLAFVIGAIVYEYLQNRKKHTPQTA
ncbi:MAG: hypothetical protein EOP53_00775 [Sphingobacteriales bacterium]|nr:MAG: hypothetical protein EOP53_00775 [Sphingobacteriales bacterium]